MKRGGKPKPAALKILTGNPGKRPIRDEPKPSDRLPDQPAALSEAARPIFAELVATLDEIGLATATDTRALQNCAERIAEFEALTATLAKSGLTYRLKGSPALRVHPALAARHKASQAMESLLNDFGLTRAGAARLTALPRKDPAPSRFSWRGGSTPAKGPSQG